MDTALVLDTAPDAAAVQLAAWRALAPSQKIAMVRDLSMLVLKLEREGLRRRFPTLSAQALEAKAIERRLGMNLARRAYSPATRER